MYTDIGENLFVLYSCGKLVKCDDGGPLKCFHDIGYFHNENRL